MSTSLIRPELVQLGATPADKNEAIRMAGRLLAKAGYIESAYIESLIGRENVANTCLGSGVAIPHGMVEHRHLIKRTGIAVLQVPQGIAWNAQQNVQLVFAIAAQSDEHLQLLRRLTRLLQDEATLQKLYTTQDVNDILLALDQTPADPNATPATDFAQGFDWIMSYPNGLHARPAQAWIETARRFQSAVRVRKDMEAGDGKNLIGLLQLGIAQGEKIHVSAQGDDAVAALTALRKTMDGLQAEEQAAADRAAKQLQAARANSWQPAGKPQVLQGVAASSGVRVGVLQVRQTQALEVPDTPQNLTLDGKRLDAALQDTRTELLELATETTARLGATEGGIFKAQAEVLGDTDLISLTCQAMVQGHGVAWSWYHAVEHTAQRLAGLSNALLAARAADVRDVGMRVLSKLAPELHLQPATTAAQEQVVIAANDLTPSDTAVLDTSKVAGLVTAQGGPTSHTAIIARTLGIPAVVAAGANLLTLKDGSPVVIDGDAGVLYTHLSDADLASARAYADKQQEQMRAAAAQALEPAITVDGHRVDIAANVNRPDQVPAALAAGAEGVGLMRTEFLFLERNEAPSEEEQYYTYCDMIAGLAGKPLIIRTLDIGGDKQVDYLHLPREENPFLGVRGSRLMLRRPDLLEPQLRAIYRAAQTGPVHIMFPMVTRLDELLALRAAAERARKAVQGPEVPIGIMIEVPAAVAMAPELAAHCDFFSIGTNDLTQYVLAVDRQHPELAREADSLHPAVVRMMAQTIAGARHASTDGHTCWVGVCGGLAGDPLGAAILTGLGVQELSMSPNDIAKVKATLRSHSHAEMEAIAIAALRCADAQAVRALASRLKGTA